MPAMTGSAASATRNGTFLKNNNLLKISVFKNGSSSYSYLHAVLKDPGSSAF
jgi:hypothetical protein